MAFFRQYIAPLFIFAIFFVALAAVSARIFLPSDMAQPAPVEYDTLSLHEFRGSPMAARSAPFTVPVTAQGDFLAAQPMLGQ
jgi:hypothetical protein